MISYPVIYTRTLNCDYFSNFHVLPEFVDANWLLPYIRSATTDMNPTSNQTKRIVVSDKKIAYLELLHMQKILSN